MDRTTRALAGLALAALLIGVTCSCGGGAAPGGGGGKGRVYKVGVASYAPDPGADRLLEGLYAGLAREGFTRGANLEVEHATAAGEMANIPLLLQNLDGKGLDLIVTLTTPVLANACQVVRQTPVVFCYVTDPIAAGAGSTFADHLPNLTGVGSFDPVEESFDVLAMLRPGLKSVGTLYNASEANSTRVVNWAREITRQRGIKLEEVTIASTSDVMLAAETLVTRDVDALWVTTDNTAAQAFSAIGGVAKKARIPLVANENEQIAAGALIAVGASWRQVGEITAVKAARVLRGEAPKDIPFENFVGATVTLNRPLAAEIGLEVPPALLALDGKNAPRPDSSPR